MCVFVHLCLLTLYDNKHVVSIPPLMFNSCEQATRKEQAAALLEVLLRKDNRAYISFYNALVRESYGDLASLLHPDLPMGSPEAEKSFSDGGTPLGERASTGNLQGFLQVVSV